MHYRLRLNNALNRPLQQGPGLCELLPKSSCEVSVLGDGDTFYSVDHIAKNIKKNTAQTAKAAKSLATGNLKDDVAAIYRELYKNLQYKADGKDQNLRSPACSCHSRHTGIDCKSFTIFAGCLLWQMGHSFHIRQIKQKSVSPQLFTHVYIVVPNDQKSKNLSSGYYVLDPTTHDNKEANYTTKHDTYMKAPRLPHYGLQGANTATPGTMTLPPDTQGFYGDAKPVTATAKQGFYDFLNFLREVGIKKKIIAVMKAYAEKFFARGVDPTFKIIKQDDGTAGVVINNTFFPFEVEPGCIPKSPLKIANRERNRLNGLYAPDPDPETEEEPASTEEIGDEIATVAQDILNDSGWFDSTISAVLGNGWDLSCWGASNSPKQSKNEVVIDAETYLQNSGVQNNLTTETFRKFLEPVSAYIIAREYGMNNGDLAGCTRDGNKAGHAAMQGFRNDVISAARDILAANGGKLIKGPDKKLTNYNFPVPSGYHNGAIRTGHVPLNMVVPTYTVEAPKPVSIPAGTGQGSLPQGGGSSTGGGSTTTGGGTSSTGGGTATGGTTPVFGGGGSPSGGSSSTLPAGFQSWPRDQQRLYSLTKLNGNNYLLTRARREPSLQLSDQLLAALGITRARINEVRNYGTTSNPQSASGNTLLVLLVGGALAYNYYAKNKKKSTKKLTA